MYSAECNSKLSITREGKVIIYTWWHPGISEWFPAGLVSKCLLSKAQLRRSFRQANRHRKESKRRDHSHSYIADEGWNTTADWTACPAAQRSSQVTMLTPGMVNPTPNSKLPFLFKIIYHFPGLESLISQKSHENPFLKGLILKDVMFAGNRKCFTILIFHFSNTYHLIILNPSQILASTNNVR